MIRLVKGAMAPPDHVAFTRRRGIDENYLKLASMMLSDEARLTGFMPVFGSHHRELVEYIAKVADERGWSVRRSSLKCFMASISHFSGILCRSVIGFGFMRRLGRIGGLMRGVVLVKTPQSWSLLRSRLNATGL